MSALTISGQIVGIEPTKGGKWLRIMLAGARRINDLVMVPADSEVAKVAKAGQQLDKLPVRASVETTAEGRPMRSIVYFLADQPG